MIRISRDVVSPCTFGYHVEDYLQYLGINEETFLKETGIAKERMHQSDKL